MIKKLLSLLILCTVLIGALALGAGAQDDPAKGGVLGSEAFLSEEQRAQINEALWTASEQTGVPVYAYIYRNPYRTEESTQLGDHVRAAYGLRGDLVLMVVEVTSYETYYHMYTYGDTAYKINQKEIDYLMDSDAVYRNLKRNDYVDGLCAYAELTVQAYNGRLGISGWIILFFALIIGAVAGALAMSAVKSSYARKNPSASYPLDRFAKLDLNRRDDRVTGRFVTHTIISTGGRGGRGGGASRGGGGGGYRGSR